MPAKSLKNLVLEKAFPAERRIPDDLLDLTAREIQEILKRNIRLGQISITGFYAESMLRMGLLIPISESKNKYEFTDLAKKYC